jgi:hypothetical protein
VGIKSAILDFSPFFSYWHRQAPARSLLLTPDFERARLGYFGTSCRNGRKDRFKHSGYHIEYISVENYAFFRPGHSHSSIFLVSSLVNLRIWCHPLIHGVKDSVHSLHHHGQELLLINFTIFSSFFPELRRPSMNQQCNNVNGRRAGSPGGPFNIPKLCTVSEFSVQAKVGRWSNILDSSEYHGTISIIVNSHYQ